jgi:uncharacterized protein YuzE
MLRRIDMPGYDDFESEIKKAGKIVGILIENNSSSIGYKDGIRIALEAIIKEIYVGKDRKAELLYIEANKILEKAKSPRKKLQCLINPK